MAYQFGEWRVEPELNRLVRGDQEVSLEPKTMAVLQRLLARHGRLVTLDDLLDHVWVGRVVEPGSVQRHITRLRRILQDDPRAPTYIETIKKRGYRAIAPVQAMESAPEVADLETDVSGKQSIAVLPLENLSPDPDNAFFAAGVHEELLTRLAQIRALKVISRTSVLEYVDRPKNIRHIAKELGVSSILEGTVRRAGEEVRISVQLIDAESDQHIWAETYDRELTAQSLFAIQSDIATSIVGALQVTLLPHETARLAEIPTQSTRAYDFYLIGNDYFKGPDDPRTLPLALQMYERALDEDPEFALAHAAVSHAHSRFHWVGLDRTDARLELAKAAFERAFELAPGLPEAHLAAGQYYYRGFGDYARALDEYTIAERGMSKSAELAMARAEAYRRFGNLQKSLAHWEEAMSLDPRNALPVFQAGVTALMQRDYERADQYTKRGFELRPDETLYMDLVPLCRDGDVSCIAASGTYGWLRAIYKRDFDAQLTHLAQWAEPALTTQWFHLPKASVYGLTYRLVGDSELARSNFEAARVQIQQALAANANDSFLQIAMGEALAGVGESRAAVRLAEQAMALRPTSADAMIGPAIQLDAVLRVFLPAGDYARAIEELDAYLKAPGVWSIEGLLPDPRLDPIRDDPRFQELINKYKRG